jgi:hypothetical protein
MPSRVFLSKSAEAIENKGREPGKMLQESSRVRKLKEVEEIEVVKEFKEKISAKFVGGSGEGIGVRRWFAVGGLGGRFFALRPISRCIGVASQWGERVSRSSAHFMQ